MTDMSIKDFTEALASKTSVPGGGGASALAAAIGIALGDMVGEFTIGKKKYASVEEDIQLLMAKAQALREDLLECISDDAKAFEPLSKAYAIPKDQPDRDEIMENCLRSAAMVPLRIMELATAAIELQGEFAKKGSVIMISDAATGAALLEGAIKGAAVNVKINTKSMKDREFAERINKKTDFMLEKYSALADEIFDSIYGSY